MKPIKRWNHYDIVYRIPGYKKTFTESFKTVEEANIRIAEIDYLKSKGKLRPPTKKAVNNSVITVSAFMDEYVHRYGENKWGDSYYSCSMHRIEHYIKPYIGDYLLRDITTADIDDFYNTLRETPAVVLKGHKDEGKKVSHDVIDKVNGLLRSAFGKAVDWNYISVNPVIGATLATVKKKKRDVWTPQDAKRAIDLCTDDPGLRICIMLAVGCSLRIGEILGLQWSSIHITDQSLQENSSFLEVRQELKRCKKDALRVMEAKNRSDVFFIFPEVFRERKEDCKTSMVLKSPKTESSVRELFIPNSVAEALLEWKAMQEQQKQAALDAWEDYDLVITLPNGRPREERLIAKAFKDFIQEKGLPPVVFHSLRHLSTSMKLQASGGDIKAVQGDTGHAQASMVTEVYSTTFTENRKRIADKLQESFFGVDSQKRPELSQETQKLLDLLNKNPELNALILAMAQKTA